MVEIIAEIGSSPAPVWNFTDWCSTAAWCGATHIKAQCFKSGHFPLEEQASKKPLEFPRERLNAFVDVARSYGLKAGMSVFDDEAVKLTVEHCDFVKLACREMNNAVLQVRVLSSGAKKIYRSIDEYFWYGGGDQNGLITHLYAIQKYPATLTESIYRLTLWASHTRRSGSLWGWSSHTAGWLDCRLAAKLGASTVEKHLALTPRDIEAGHSLLPDQFKRMCEAINGKS